jgi:beta-galactosidase/beta-glucuronidase
MTQPHVIRLRGPWHYEPLAQWELDAQGARQTVEMLPPAGRMVMPGDWAQPLGRDFRGRVRFVRAFGRPTRLEPDEQVWLVCDGVDLTGWASLNGEQLGPVAGFREAARFEVTGRLNERNELVIEVELPPLAYADEQQLRPDRAGLAGGVIGEVRLEIFQPVVK